MDHLVRSPIWSAAAITASGTLTSPTIEVSLLTRIEGFEIKVTSVTGAANVKLEYAMVDDDGNVSSFANEPDIIGSTNTEFTGPEEWHAVPMPSPLARRIQLRVTELSGSLADTKVSLIMVLRETIAGGH